jgi:HTH-type transcriptional regulator/antitoxin HigA
VPVLEIRPIKTEKDYRSTLREIETLMSAAPDSPEGERLDVLVTLVEEFERKHLPMGLS